MDSPEIQRMQLGLVPVRNQNRLKLFLDVDDARPIAGAQQGLALDPAFEPDTLLVRCRISSKARNDDFARLSRTRGDRPAA